MWSYTYSNAELRECSCPTMEGRGVLLVGIILGFILHMIWKSILRWLGSTNAINNNPTKDNLTKLTLDNKGGGFQVLEEAISLFAHQMNKTRDNSKVVQYLSPQQMLTKLFSKDAYASLNLSNDFNNNDANVHQMIQCFRDIQKYSVNTSHPFFFNQLFGALDPIALAAELVALSVNTSAYTYETAPVFTMIEREVFAQLGRLVFEHGGLPQDWGEVGDASDDASDPEKRQGYDGLMLPGGALSNLTSLHVARYYARRCLCRDGGDAAGESYNGCNFQEEKKEQEQCTDAGHLASIPDLVAFVSSEAHYSFTKAVAVTGIGIKNLVIVPTLPNGQMDAEKLDVLMTQLANEHGCAKMPFFVAATAGSTVRGSFDDIEAIVRVCRKHEDRLNHAQQPRLNDGNSNVGTPPIDYTQHKNNAKHKIWIHVDGAWGGSAIFSSRRDIQSLMKGLKHVDSFTFNPHKMLGAPQQTTAFVTRHEGILKAANSSGAKYLFDKRKNGAEYDLGDASYTCGRRTDAIKLWALWKYYGPRGIGKMLEAKVDALQLLAQRVRESDRFMLACEPWPFNVNFFYLPERFRQRVLECGVDIESDNPEIPHDISRDLADVSVKLKLRLHQSGEMLIPYQPLSNQEADCFRIVLAGNKPFDEKDIETVLDLMDKYGHDL